MTDTRPMPVKIVLRTAWERVRCALGRLVRHPQFVPWCLGAAAVLRVLWILAFDPQPVSDFLCYYERAITLAQGGGYTSGGVPTAYFPPGYPAFLALIFTLTGPSLLAAKIGNVLLQLGSLYLAYRLARRLFASEEVGRVTLLLLAIYPNFIAYCGLLASEHLFIFLMLLGLALLLEGRHRHGLLLVAGLLFGLATLTRPQGIFLPFIFFALELLPDWRNRQQWRWGARVAVTYLGLALVVAPWMARNYTIFHHPLLTTTTGTNLYIGNNPDANGIYIWTERMKAVLPPHSGEYTQDLACGQAARAYIHAHPLQVLVRMPLKVLLLYTTDLDGAQWTYKALPHASRTDGVVLWWAMWLSEQYYLLMLLLFILALGKRTLNVAKAFSPAPLPALGLCIIVVFTAVYMVYYSADRYHLPMMPWIMMYAAALLVHTSLSYPPAGRSAHRAH